MANDREAAGPAARRALVDAAARLLPHRAPSAITGRELAAEAGVNYGLVQHYFAGKDGALAAGLVALRDDFLRVHGDGGSMPFLGRLGHPYLQALVRAEIDQPGTLGRADKGFPVAEALVHAVTARLDEGGEGDGGVDVEAKARAIAAMSLQVCYGVFGEALLESAGVADGERAAVEDRLAGLYEALVARAPGVV